MWICPKCNREFKNTNQSHYCGKVDSIDGYIADQSEDIQPILQSIRETIMQTAPELVETVKWAMPYFLTSNNEGAIGFAMQKKHISFFPSENAVNHFADRLEGYKFSKGTIQLPIDKSIDHKLIGDIVHWVINELK